MMKPKAEDKHETGLLEYLEDIIGTDKYVALIEASSKRCVCLRVNACGAATRLDPIRPYTTLHNLTQP